MKQGPGETKEERVRVNTEESASDMTNTSFFRNVWKQNWWGYGSIGAQSVRVGELGDETSCFVAWSVNKDKDGTQA